MLPEPYCWIRLPWTACSTLRRLLLTRLEHAGDPRRDRYAKLLAVINGWPSPDSLAPAFTWSIEAVRARLER